jgi:long-chain acyl-CoA synthetase
MTELKFAKERLLSILPLSHIYEQAGGLFLAQFYGAHVIYAHSPSAIGDLLKEYKITKMLAVPEFLKILMGKIETAVEERGKKKIFEKMMRLSLKIPFLSRLLFRSVHKKLGGKLDTIVSGGAPLDPVLERKWNALGVVLFQSYGLTETSPLVTSNTHEEHKFGSVGKIAPGVTARISEAGEIQVKGPNVFAGYFKNEEKTKEVFTSDGFFKTEDMGEFDKDGFLFLKGRKKYMIVGPGGQNVFPEDIEEVLNEMEGVKDSCVVGLELASGMVQIHAVFLLDDPTLDPKPFINQANEKLSSYQHITGYSVWPKDDFPRSATRKVKKNDVLEFLREQKREKTDFVPDKKSPLTKLLASITGVDSSQVGEHTKLVSELQIDSLMRIELITRVEEELGVLIEETDIQLDTTVADLEKLLLEKKPVQSLSPLKKWPRSWWARGVRFLGQKLIFLLMRIFVKIRVEGLENLKDLDLPIVLMPNHTSYLDVFILIKSLPRRVRSKFAIAAANDVLYGYFKRVAPIGELLFNTFPFPRKEHENIRLGLDYMGKLLDDKHSIIVYPEGKISLDGKLLPLKRGAGLIAVEMGAVVVPVIIEGSNDILPYAKMVPRKRGTVRIVFGKPQKFKIGDSYIDATDKIEDLMRGMYKRP